jgi:hypothetical protein
VRVNDRQKPLAARPRWRGLVARIGDPDLTVLLILAVIALSGLLLSGTVLADHPDAFPTALAPR